MYELIIDPPLWALGLLLLLVTVCLFLTPRRDQYFALFLGTLMALALGESVLRVVRVYDFAFTARPIWVEEFATTAGAGPFQQNSQLRYRYPSNPRGYFNAENEVIGAINSFGFRGPETTVEKPDDKIRIAVLGDSFTLGVGVKDHHTLPAQLERKLEERGWPVEVLNFGVSGSHTLRQLTLLREFVIQFKPDLILQVIFLNDARLQGTNRFFSDRKYFTRVRRHSHLARLVFETLEGRRRNHQMVQHYMSGYSDTSPGWRAMQSALLEANDLAKSIEAKYLVAIYPVLFRLDSGYPFLAIHRRLGDFLRASDIDAVDLQEALSAEKDREMWVHTLDQHPNEVAHEFSARTLSGIIERLIHPL
jgi:lysophospholipase L1-like esterase